jgi:hypothetical protein
VGILPYRIYPFPFNFNTGGKMTKKRLLDQVQPAGKLVKAAVSILLESVDPLLGCLPGDTKAFSQFGNGVVVQLVVFEESLSLFSYGNTFPGHGLHLLHDESVTHVFRICVTYVLEWFTKVMRFIPLD